MLDRGLLPDFTGAVFEQLARIGQAASAGDVRDLRNLQWCSIDNDDSRDLDQLSTSEELPGGSVRVLIAVADVDALVAKGTPIDEHASTNTTSVYTAGQIFPMLPERLSTDLTSLNQDQDRVSLVIEFAVTDDGTIRDSQVYRAVVRNKAKLAYNAVAAWLDGHGPLPAAAAQVPGLDIDLRRQEAAAARLRQQRRARGSLELESLEARPVFEGENVVALETDRPNRAKDLIADFMIAANGVVARFLEQHRRPSLRRVVRSPERWEKIVGLAAQYGERLPMEASSPALEAFLERRRALDPLRFPDLSLTVVKLMGRGEYVAEVPGERPIGHFGLAVQDYAHSTAPNRRFPDLVTHRLVKAVLAGASSPYTVPELLSVATQSSQQEANAAKVERQVRKSAAALLLERRVGESFTAIVTGASPKGTYARLLDPPIEGRIVRGHAGLGIGDKVRVTLVGTDFERGYIDFAH
jgi:VacB/RNase II family 3'-5' exoribonuclease